jgi:hypothetical protein
VYFSLTGTASESLSNAGVALIGGTSQAAKSGGQWQMRHQQALPPTATSFAELTPSRVHILLQVLTLSFNAQTPSLPRKIHFSPTPRTLSLPGFNPTLSLNAVSSFPSSSSAYGAYGRVCCRSRASYETCTDRSHTGNTSIYPLLALYGASSATTTWACLATVLTMPGLKDQLPKLLASYVPFFLVPFAMAVDYGVRLTQLSGQQSVKGKTA